MRGCWEKMHSSAVESKDRGSNGTLQALGEMEMQWCGVEERRRCGVERQQCGVEQRQNNVFVLGEVAMTAHCSFLTDKGGQCFRGGGDRRLK
ncbi:hypothetical protein HN51_021149 [Arachis hypogaea]